MTQQHLVPCEAYTNRDDEIILSQSGMVVHWLRGGDPSRRRKAVVNGMGAVATAIVTLVIGMTKFLEGAWIVVVIVPVMIALFLMVNQELFLGEPSDLQSQTQTGPRCPGRRFGYSACFNN